MLKAFKESVTNFVKTKPEVKRRPLIEQLIDDWEYVHKNFYQEHPDIERVHITQTDVPQRLSRIVKILSEEESMKTNQKEIHGFAYFILFKTLFYFFIFNSKK